MARFVAFIAQTEGTSRRAGGASMTVFMTVSAVFRHINPICTEAIVEAGPGKSMSECFVATHFRIEVVISGNIKDGVARAHEHPRVRISENPNIEHRAIIRESVGQALFQFSGEEKRQTRESKFDNRFRRGKGSGRDNTDTIGEGKTSMLEFIGLGAISGIDVHLIETTSTFFEGNCTTAGRVLGEQEAVDDRITFFAGREVQEEGPRVATGTPGVRFDKSGRGGLGFIHFIGGGAGIGWGIEE
jgi:hypothetical protein